MYYKADKYIKTFTDMMNEGFIVIDNEGIIRIYNEKAKSIFGINRHLGASHPGGRIEEGDIVIIADNDIGKDDGDLSSKDFRLIGIDDPMINKGDAIVAIGVYKDRQKKPVYRKMDRASFDYNLSLEQDYLGQDIDIDINFKSRNIRIAVNGKAFNMRYFSSVGHIVIVDGRTKEVKFYQHYGYTAREECLNCILHGKRFMAKGEGSEALIPVGKKIADVNKSSIIDRLMKVATGQEEEAENIFEDINGIPTLCSILRVEDGEEILGAALKVEDISLITEATISRDRAIKKLKRVEERLYEDDIVKKAFPAYVGESDRIQRVKKMALKASNSNSNVLILGESGTGKTVLAKAIHENSKVKDKPFVQINCGAIPESLLESELFGYEGGAFTGAKQEGKKGLFQIAHGGTIFLDEIGDMSPKLQVKLLQTIQDKSFYPVGGTQEVKIDVRIIAATNKNLEEEIAAGRFREDLYYRINVFPIWIPSLRERKEDIYPLVELILPKICKNLGCGIKKISSEAMNLLFNYDWPGNIRELENVLERAANLTEGETILSTNIMIRDGITPSQEVPIMTFKEAIELEEEKIIKRTLLLCNGDKARTMEVLDMSRSNFYKKLKDYNIK